MKTGKKNIGILALSLLASVLVACSATPSKPSVTIPESITENVDKAELPVDPAKLLGEGEFVTRGYTPQIIKYGPYDAETPVLDLEDPDKKVDETGVIIYTAADGKDYPHPIAMAQYALSALSAYYETNQAEYLDRAVANAVSILENSIAYEGALFYPYGFEWTYYDVTLSVPWFSAMAQGQVLSLLVKLNELQPTEGWSVPMQKTFASFLVPRSEDAPWVAAVDNGYLWFEEYAGDAPLLKVLNGQIFAIYGVYDYYIATQNPAAKKLFDGAVSTVFDNFDKYRSEGGPSYYCARENYCRSSDWQNHFYHPIHIDQLRNLGRMTGSDEFFGLADLLQQDFIFEG